jgi:hypothetical protein
MKTETLLYLAAAAQLGIALLNLFLVRVMNWREDLARMPLLVREVFVVHAWFISVMLGIFAALTIRFAPEIAVGAAEVFRWLAVCIAAFWGFRTVLQITYYSSSHWRGQPKRLLAHVALLTLYGGFTAVYLATVL